MMSARQHAFNHAVPHDGQPASELIVPVTDLLTRALAYRDCEKLLVDPLGVSVLSLFAMLHRLHADELLPHASAVLEMEPHSLNALGQMRDAVASDAQRWLGEFIASERQLQDIYRAAIAASDTVSTGAPGLNRLLRRQQAVLHERLTEVFAEMSRHLAPFADDKAANSQTRKGG
jgi:hypothetical protein